MADLVEPDREENAVRGDVSSGIELCLEEALSPVYKEEEPPVPKANEVTSKRSKLSSSMISVDKKKRKAERRRGSGEVDGVWRAEAEEMRIEVTEGEVTVVSKEAETENSKEMRSEKK